MLKNFSSRNFFHTFELGCLVVAFDSLAADYFEFVDCLVMSIFSMKVSILPFNLVLLLVLVFFTHFTHNTLKYFQFTPHKTLKIRAMSSIEVTEFIDTTGFCTNYTTHRIDERTKSTISFESKL